MNPALDISDGQHISVGKQAEFTTSMLGKETQPNSKKGQHQRYMSFPTSDITP